MSTHNIPLSNFPKLSQIQLCLQLWDFFFFLLKTPERVRNSRGKRVIGVRAIEVQQRNIIMLGDLQ